MFQTTNQIMIHRYIYVQLYLYLYNSIHRYTDSNILIAVAMSKQTCTYTDIHMFLVLCIHAYVSTYSYACFLQRCMSIVFGKYENLRSPSRSVSVVVTPITPLAFCDTMPTMPHLPFFTKTSKGGLEDHPTITTLNGKSPSPESSRELGSSQSLEGFSQLRMSTPNSTLTW